MLLSRTLTTLLSLLCASAAFSGPPDPENYDMISQYPAILQPGGYVEGSSRFGGIQPDYYLDLDAPEFEPLLQKARELRTSNKDLWEKVNELAKYIRTELLPGQSYDDRNYHELLTHYRNRNQDIPLSRYVCTGSGVCRENAMILHFALKEAGIPNRMVYAKAEINDWMQNRTEDHAFTIVHDQGEDWVADSYNSWFHGYRLKDFQTRQGVGPFSRKKPGSEISYAQRRVLEILSYPRIWTPKRPADCTSAFQRLYASHPER